MPALDADARSDAFAVVPARWLATAARAVAPHPSLWLTGLHQAFVLAVPGWWRRRPFLPLPAAGYLRFRLQTAYGGTGEDEPRPEDLVTYLGWCRAARRWGGSAAPPPDRGTDRGANRRRGRGSHR